MTRINPSLFVRRMCIYAHGRKVYDQQFRLGVNVIASVDNGTGKSTLCDFLFFGLGGDDPRWKPEALQCDYVDVEADFSETILTLRRFVSDQSRRPMAIAEGPIDDKDRVWEEYPYSDTEFKASFSRLLFRTLGFPQAVGSTGASITMHQLLRLMYVDQITGVNHIFRDAPFDSDNLRGAIGAFVCGVYETELYEAQLELAELEKGIADLSAQIRAIPPILAEAGQANLTPQAVLSRIEATKLKLSTLAAELSAPPQIKKPEQLESRILARDDAELGRLRRLTGDLRSQIDLLAMEMVDSELFLDSIRKRAAALKDSKIAVEALGAISVDACPSCFAPLDRAGDPLICPLCKTKHGKRDVTGRLFRIAQELELQIKESEQLQQDRIARRDALTATLQEAISAEKAIAARLDRSRAAELPAVDAGQARRLQELGYFERELRDLQSQHRLAVAVEGLDKRRAELARKKSLVTARIEKLHAAGEARWAAVRDHISEEGIEILQNDVNVEEAFKDARRLEFSFERNLIKLDGRMNFAASSMVVLKTAFHVGLLASSLEDKGMRYPRFLLMDNIEDKGMVAERSHAMQRAMYVLSESTSVDHQIIYTTANPLPSLLDGVGTVGGVYSKTRKTLDLPAVQSGEWRQEQLPIEPS